MEAPRTRDSKTTSASDDHSARKKRTRHLTLFRVSKAKKKNVVGKKQKKNEKIDDSKKTTTTAIDNSSVCHLQPISSSEGHQQHQVASTPKQQRHLKGGRLFGSFLLSRGWAGNFKSVEDIQKSTTTVTPTAQMELERDEISTSITRKLPPPPSSSPRDLREKEKGLSPLESLLHADGAVIIPDRPRNNHYETTRAGATKQHKQSNVVQLCRMVAVVVVGTFLVLVSLGGESGQKDSSILIRNHKLKDSMKQVNEKSMSTFSSSSSSSLLTSRDGEEEEEEHTIFFEEAPAINNLGSKDYFEEVVSISEESDSSSGSCKSAERMMAPIKSFQHINDEEEAEIEKRIVNEKSGFEHKEKKAIEKEREDRISKEENIRKNDTTIPSHHEERNEKDVTAQDYGDNSTSFWILLTYFCLRAPDEVTRKSLCMYQKDNRATLEARSVISNVRHSSSKGTPNGSDSRLSNLDRESVPAFDEVVAVDDFIVLEQNLSENRSSTSTDEEEAARTMESLSVPAFIFYTYIFFLGLSFLHRSDSTVENETDKSNPRPTDATSRPPTAPLVAGPPLEILLPNSCQAVEEGPDGSNPQRMHTYDSEVARCHEDQEEDAKAVTSEKESDFESEEMEITTENSCEESNEEEIPEKATTAPQTDDSAVPPGFNPGGLNEYDETVEAEAFVVDAKQAENDFPEEVQQPAAATGDAATCG